MDTRLPKYWAVVDYIEKLIRSEGLEPGDGLPTELELQERFRLSRGTVRKALDQLRAAGLIERRSGTGTFVAPRRMPRALPELTGFSEHLRSLGLCPGTRLLSKAVLPEPNGFTQDFPAGAKLMEYVRLRLADDNPVGIHRLVLPVDLAERVRVEDDPQRGTLYDRMEAAGVAVDVAQEHLVARRSIRSESQLLGIRTGDAVMDVRRRTFDSSGSVVEVVHATYRGDRYDYVVWLERRRS